MSYLKECVEALSLDPIEKAGIFPAPEQLVAFYDQLKEMTILSQQQQQEEEEEEKEEGEKEGEKVEGEEDDDETVSSLLLMLNKFFGLARLDHHYFLCRSKAITSIASYLQPLPLTLPDRLVFCSVPVNIRDRMAMQHLYLFASSHAHRRPTALNIRIPRYPPTTILHMHESTTKHAILDAYL